MLKCLAGTAVIFYPPKRRIEKWQSVYPNFFGYNLECTRRVGYGGLYAEMIYNNRLLNQANGFYPVEIDGLKGLGQCTERLHLLSSTTYEWKVLAGEEVKIRIRTEYGRVLLETNSAAGFGCLYSQITQESMFLYG